MSNSLKSQTKIAAFNLGFKILTKRRPVIFSDNYLMSFVNFEMIFQEIVVIAADLLGFNYFGNLKEAFIL